MEKMSAMKARERSLYAITFEGFISVKFTEIRDILRLTESVVGLLE